MQQTFWAYQLQGVQPSEIASSPFSTVVVDRYNDAGEPFTAAEVRQMGGGAADARITLGYMSVGEAEDYRDYWQSGWGNNPPSWLGPENPDWAGNFQVRYWDAGWQNILFDYLDGIIAAGFDGAWFDVVDVFQSRLAAQRPDAAQDMVDLVVSLSEHAKAANPNFKIYINNAEELLAHPEYLAAIDGVNKEDLYFSLDGKNRPNDPGDVSASLEFLQLAQDAGKPVLNIEYVTTEAAIAQTIANAERDGFVTYVAPLDLDTLDYTIPNKIGFEPVPGGPLEPPSGEPPQGPGLPPEAPGEEGPPSDGIINGTPGDDWLNGGDSDDELDGGPGQDVMRGGAGNDTYHVDDPGDVIREQAGEGGADTVYAYISYALDVGLEKLILQGLAAEGRGSAADNTIIGNDASNELFGLAGNDVVEGGAGSDELRGGAGDDLLAGGQHADWVKGGKGADTFVLDLGGASDTLVDFSSVQGDKIAVHASDIGGAAGLLSADWLVSARSNEAAPTAKDHGQFIYNESTEILYWDVDGLGGQEATQIATLNVPGLDALDFKVI